MRVLKLAPRIFQSFPEVRVWLRVAEEAVVEKENPDLLMLEKQLHGDEVLYVAGQEKGLAADGMYTDKPNLRLAVRSADCLPVLFFNKTAGVIGAIHIGWRGTAKGIIKKAIREVEAKFNTKAADFYFYFGPAAQSCCYDKDFVRDNLRQLEELGIKESQIENSGICTIHNQDYPSHRRQREKRKETILSIIGLEK